MADSTVIGVPAWRTALPMLSGPTVTLREPVADDIPFLVSVLSLGDATRFGLDDPISELSVQEFIERAARDRSQWRCGHLRHHAHRDEANSSA